MCVAGAKHDATELMEWCSVFCVTVVVPSVKLARGTGHNISSLKRWLGETLSLL